jgi:hypothetical protein
MSSSLPLPGRSNTAWVSLTVAGHPTSVTKDPNISAVFAPTTLNIKLPALFQLLGLINRGLQAFAKVFLCKHPEIHVGSTAFTVPLCQSTFL